MTKIVDLALNGSLTDTKSGNEGAMLRASTAWYMDENNILQEVASDIPRFAGIPGGGGPALLLEGPGTNSLLQSRNLDTSPWANDGTPTVVQDQIGLDEVADTAWTVGDDSTTGIEGLRQLITVPDDSNTYALSAYIKKDNDISRFPEFQMSLTDGTAVSTFGQLNTATGEATKRIGTGTVTSTDVGDWWRIELTLPNNGTGNTTLTIKLFPAVTKSVGSTDVTAVGTVVADQVQVELNQSFASSPIVTTTTAVTRATEAGVADTSGVQWDLDEFGVPGNELLTNNDFVYWTDDDPDGWSVNAEDANNYVTENNGAQIVSDGTFIAMAQEAGLEAGKKYKITYTATVVSGSVGIGSSTVLATIDTTGTFTVYIDYAGTDGTELRIKRLSACDVTLSNINMQEVTNSLTPILKEQLGSDLVTNGDFAADSDWSKGTGWTIAAGVADCDGTQSAGSNITQDLSLTDDTKLYKVTLDVTRSAGTLNVFLGTGGWSNPDSTSGPQTSVGTLVYYLKPYTVTNGLIVITGDTDFVGTVDNVVVEEVLNDSRGTLVVDWTPSRPATIGTGVIGIVSPRTSEYSLLYQDASNEDIRSFDNTMATAVTSWDWAKDVQLRIGVIWGINTSNVRQYQVFMYTGGVLSKSTLVDYDGNYDPLTYLLLGIVTTWGQQLKSLQIYDEPLTDAQLESPSLGMPGNGLNFNKGFMGE